MNIALDVNTILTSLVLGGIIWMLRSQSTAITSAALSVQRHEQAEREIIDLRARVVAAEAAVAEVSIRVAHLEGSKQAGC